MVKNIPSTEKTEVWEDYKPNKCPVKGREDKQPVLFKFVKNLNQIKPMKFQPLVDCGYGNGLFPRQGITLLAAAEKAGKTWVMLDYSINATSNRNCFGVFPSKKGTKILYLLGDFPESILSERAKILNVTVSDNLKVLSQIDMSEHRETSFNLNKPDSLVELMHYCEAWKPDQIIIDTMASWVDLNENNNEQLAKFIKGLQRGSKILNCNICLLHHKRKGSTKDDPNKLMTMDDIIGGTMLLRLAAEIIVMDAEYDVEEGEYLSKGWFRPSKGWFPRPAKFKYDIVRLKGSYSRVNYDHEAISGGKKQERVLQLLLNMPGEFTRGKFVSSLSKEDHAGKGTIDRALKFGLQKGSIQTVETKRGGKSVYITRNTLEGVL